MLNGEKDAKYYVDHYKKVHPDWTVEMYNITDENLPIEIDIEKWQAATSKFNSRNANFNMKE
jgi:FMN-dependent NADH-azoreductase